MCLDNDRCTQVQYAGRSMVYVSTETIIHLITLVLVDCSLFISSPRSNYLSMANNYTGVGERGGSVVECRTSEREVLGSRPTAAVLCP